MLKTKNLQGKSGFTIIELLVIIVVIGLLAAIGIFAYNDAQKRARDTKRVANAESIVQAIGQYAHDKGEFPAPQESAEIWEQSSEQQENFLRVLYADNYLRGEPLLDPRNTYEYQYKYYVFEDSFDVPCDKGRGGFFVLGVKKLEALGETDENNPHVPSGPIPVASPQSHGWVCSTGGLRDFQNEFSWVAGGYLDEYITTP